MVLTIPLITSKTTKNSVMLSIVFFFCRAVSNLVLHMEVAQIGIEKIRFHVVCAVHTVMRKSDLSHVSKKIRFGPHLPAV